MSIQKLNSAKQPFEAASRQHGNADYATTQTAQGLVHLTDALIELCRDMDAIKPALHCQKDD